MTSFLRKHQRLISFIGISIVLVTFLLHDVFREHLKDLADSLDQMRGVFSIRAQLIAVNERIRFLQHDLEFQSSLPDIRRIAKTGETFDDKQSAVINTLDRDFLTIQDLQTTLASLNGILEKLPARVTPSNVVNYRMELTQLKQRRDEMATEMDRCHNSRTPDETCSQEFIDNMDKQSDDLDDSLVWIRIDLQRASDSVLNDAELVLRQRENWFFWISVGSVLSYILGWLLGLIGMIYNVPGTTGASPI